MAYTQANSLSSNFPAYFSQWLNKDTNGNVVASLSYEPFAKWVVLRCLVCKDNWNVGLDLFTEVSSTPIISIPKEVSNWTKLHRHPTTACNHFEAKEALIPDRCICGHYAEAHGVVLTNYVPVAKREEFHGRKFRD